MTQLAKLDVSPASPDASSTLAPRLAQKYPDRVTGAFVIPAREGSYAALPEALPERLAAAMRARSPTTRPRESGAFCFR